MTRTKPNSESDDKIDTDVRQNFFDYSMLACDGCLLLCNFQRTPISFKISLPTFMLQDVCVRVCVYIWRLYARSFAAHTPNKKQTYRNGPGYA